MSKNKKIKKASEEQKGLNSSEYQLHKLPPLKWKVLKGKSILRCRVLNPRWASIPYIDKDCSNKVFRGLNNTKSMRLLGIKVFTNGADYMYEGNLTRLLVRRHYLRIFDFPFQFNKQKDFDTVRKQILKQKNLRYLAILSRWNKPPDEEEEEEEQMEIPRLKSANVQFRLLHRVGRSLKKLLLWDVFDKKVGAGIDSRYFPNLERFTLTTTCEDVCEPYPKITDACHGKLMESILSIAKLKGVAIRTCENLAAIGFWKRVCKALEKRNTPVHIEVGCGVWGFDDGKYNRSAKYEKDLKQALKKSLKPGQVFSFSSSYTVFRFKCVEKVSKKGGGHEIEEDQPEDSEEEEEEDEEGDEDLYNDD